MGSNSARNSTTAVKATRALIDEINKEEVLDVAPLAYATPPKSPLVDFTYQEPKGSPHGIAQRLRPSASHGEASLNSPLPRQRPPWLDFSGKQLHNDRPPCPTTGEITPKKPVMVCLFPTLDLPTPTPDNEQRTMVVSNKSEDSLRLTTSGSTTPNPKRVKYEVTRR